MKKVLPKWCKEAKIAMIEKDMSIKELAKELNFSRVYLSSILNGRQYTPSAVKAISDYLNIRDCNNFWKQ
jgi:transcriptional regulator with XRE-family HTH domain